MPLVGGIVTGDQQSHTDLPNSLPPFPPAEQSKIVMLQADFRAVSYRLLMMGTVALQVAVV